MAWRDSRKSKGKLLLFILSISLGIAAMVGITSFRENLLAEIDDQAKSLLGADVEVRGNQPLPDSLMMAFYELAPEVSREVYFASMVYFPSTDGTRLAQVRALSGKYPYYGEIETEPAEASREFQNGMSALVDEKLMIQYNVSIGDSVKVGEQRFKIIGRLQKMPGQTDIGATAAPVVYIPYNKLDQTDLLKKGSRVNYLNYFLFSDKVDTTGKWSKLVSLADKKGYSIDDIEERKEDTGRAFRDLTNFLELVAFTALLLGCIGVASSMYVYTKEKVGIVATLRCLGMKSGQAISIFLIQVGIFGFIGSAIGSLIGVGLHVYLPVLVSEFIPVDLEPTFSWLAISSGIAIGVVVSVLFALISLVSLRKVSPLQAIRADLGQSGVRFDKVQILVGFIIFLFLWLLVYLQINHWLDAGIFTVGLLLTIFILGLIGRGLALLIKKIIPDSIPYVWRQGLSNLYRPHNQTSLLVTTLGLGTAFIGTLLFMQDLLVDRVSITGEDDRPNTVLFDIQTPQKEELKQLTLDYDLPVLQEVPIVTMRLEEINGVSKNGALADTTINIRDWVYDREYRVTYRDSLIDSETLKEGKWTGHYEPGDSLFVSISSGFAESLELEIGDELLFNVQGALVKTYIGSFREIDWRRVQTNFLVLFPEGILERAPQFHVLITRIQNNELSARYQQAVVRSYPNVSIIDLELILKTLEDILGKIAFVIRFMAFFSIGTGVIMLISSIVLSRFQRMRENVLLRTLGASSKKLWKIIFAEYFFLGGLGALSGLLIATIITTLLGKFVFEFVFVPDFTQMIWVTLAVTSMTVLIGLVNSRDVIRQSPLEVLRKEI
ncbi:MAG: ABC transporter permease [Flammeovirgaceae bacterium]|nr:ABC transporter permease [Flammeovirgaceae bacterium]MBE63394.1 ABC transporter permease [Flammeovirgaceae bacterium]MBR06159.1 ABC transporter permease [Rickettsiales bacterium]HCX20436.1 ABC transporter permease [Cytophagales bacterium]